MKNIIKNWLGISAIERNVFENDTAELNARMREMVVRAIEATLNEEPNDEWYPYINRIVETKALHRALERSSAETATNIAKFEIRSRIDN